MKNWNASRIVLWITIVQFFFTMAFYWFSFQTFSGRDNPAYNFEATHQIKSEVKQINADYSQTESRYKETIDSLNTRLFYTDMVLKKEMFVSRERKKEIEELLSQRWDTLSTEIKLSECDSLREKTAAFIVIQQSKDSLYGQKILELTALHESTHRQLMSCDTTNEKLNQQINVALLHTQQCEQQIKRLKKQNRIFKIGAGAIAIIAVGFIFK